MFQIDDMVTVSDATSEFHNMTGIIIDMYSDDVRQSEMFVVQTEDGELLEFAPNQLDKNLD